jgi:hypothetical protein
VQFPELPPPDQDCLPTPGLQTSGERRGGRDGMGSMTEDLLAEGHPPAWIEANVRKAARRWNDGVDEGSLQHKRQT